MGMLRRLMYFDLAPSKSGVRRNDQPPSLNSRRAAPRPPTTRASTSATPHKERKRLTLEHQRRSLKRALARLVREIPNLGDSIPEKVQWQAKLVWRSACCSLEVGEEEGADAKVLLAE